MTTRRNFLLLTALAVMMAACGTRTSVPLRPEPVPYADTLPGPQPRERGAAEIVRLLESSVGGELGSTFSLRNWLGAEHEALNVTRFDDVVNSAWFEHRNAERRLTPREVARGATTVGPDTARTLTVIAGKAAGISPGFTVRDANGETFLFKFDPKGNLHLASAAGVISSRLFWAAGYHTPEDFIVVFDSAQLVLDPEAKLDTGFKVRAMTVADIQAVLNLTDPLPDGRFLAIASKFVPGKPLGPFFFSGVRKDDPNDYYYHEYRRELRGLYVIAAWLNHVDMRFANTLDVFIDPPGYVRHYLIDFAATLGSGTVRSHNPREGTEYNFDLWASLGRIFSLGFFKVGWEGLDYREIHPAIGWLSVDSFEPGNWKANWPNPAFKRRTVRDGYWGAKLVGSFSDEQIAAAVAEGYLPDAAAEALTRILIQRRDKVVAYWYAKIAPIENLMAQLTNDDGAILEIAFDDLGLTAGLWTSADTRYAYSFKDMEAGMKLNGESDAGPGTRQTLRLPLKSVPQRGSSADEADDFAALRLSVIRSGASRRASTIYLRWKGPAVGYEIAGLEH